MDDAKIRSKALGYMILQALLIEKSHAHGLSRKPWFSPDIFSFFHSDMKKVGVTVVGPQKKIISSIKALETQSKNGPVPV